MREKVFEYFQGTKIEVLDFCKICNSKERYPVYLTKKGYYWKCWNCGATKFFYYLDKRDCIHEDKIKWKMTKNKYLSKYCPICSVRYFALSEQKLKEFGFDVKKSEVK